MEGDVDEKELAYRKSRCELICKTVSSVTFMALLFILILFTMWIKR